jgi:hypothetical protein
MVYGLPTYALLVLCQSQHRGQDWYGMQVVEDPRAGI